jgi:hypothetical protein
MIEDQRWWYTYRIECSNGHGGDWYRLCNFIKEKKRLAFKLSIASNMTNTMEITMETAIQKNSSNLCIYSLWCHRYGAREHPLSFHPTNASCTQTPRFRVPPGPLSLLCSSQIIVKSSLQMKTIIRNMEWVAPNRGNRYGSSRKSLLSLSRM